VLAILIRIYSDDHKWKIQVTHLWTIEDVKLPVNYSSKRKPAWKELMVGIFVSVIVCSLHMPEKSHIGMILSAAHLCVWAQELLDRFWWNFVWSYAIGGHPRLVQFSFLHLLAELWQMHYVPQLKWCNCGKHWKHIGHMNSSHSDDSNHSKNFTCVWNVLTWRCELRVTRCREHMKTVVWIATLQCCLTFWRRNYFF